MKNLWVISHGKELWPTDMDKQEVHDDRDRKVFVIIDKQSQMTGCISRSLRFTEKHLRNQGSPFENTTVLFEDRKT